MSEIRVINAPSVYLVGRQSIDESELSRFLADEGVSGWGTDTDVGGEKLVEVAGRTCYMSFARPRPGGNAAYVGHLLDVGHGSVMEHAVFNLIITGISRSCSHELVRHRHLSPSQLSQRYVDSSDVAFVVPPALAEEYAASEFAERLRSADAESSRATWEAVTAEVAVRWPGDGGDVRKVYVLARPFERWFNSVETSLSAYVELVEHLELTFPADLNRTARRKAAREAARSVLPNCTATALMLSGNARAWRGMIEQRATAFADQEIRRLAVAILDVLRTAAPNLFGDYVTAPDGTISTPNRKV